MAEINQFINSSFSNDEEVENGAIDYRKGVKYLVDTAPKMKKLPSEFLLKLEQNPLSVSYSDIPVIDLSQLSRAVGCRVSCIDAISSACAQWGFFRVSSLSLIHLYLCIMINDSVCFTSFG